MEIPHAYPELSVIENLEAARRLHPGTPRKAVGTMIERLSLSAYANRRAGNLSQGNAQRLGLAKALLHSPRLLLLDEPTLGLDPAGIVEIRELLLELTREGVTVFMSSHLLAEVARLGGRIGIIHQGRLIRELDSAQLDVERQRRLLLGALRRGSRAPRPRRGRSACGPAAGWKLAAHGGPPQWRTRRRSTGCWCRQARRPPACSSRRKTWKGISCAWSACRRLDMSELGGMVWVETRKALRSRMPLWTALAALFFPLGVGFLIFVSRNPEISKKLGLISAKADLVAFSGTDWTAFLNFASQMTAIGGFMLLIFIISWVFGREFADGTLKDLLAVPVRRSSILLAKFIVTWVWSLGLTGVILTATLLMGARLGPARRDHRGPAAGERGDAAGGVHDSACLPRRSPCLPGSDAATCCPSRWRS